MRYSIYLALILSTSLNAGTILKWIDEEGNVSYGDSPPVSATSETVRVQSAPSDPGKALPRLSTQGNDSTSANTEGATESAAEKSAVPGDQAELACQRAKDDLKVISSSDRIKLRASDGTSRYMTSEEIDERKLQSQSDIDQFCN